jgi:hypothetical protein
MPLWETASDWDQIEGSEGVAHESVTGSDHTDAATVIRGYSYSDPPLATDLVFWLPFHDDAGSSTTTDISGNGNDANVKGGPLGGTGLLNSSGADLDGTDDYFTYSKNAVTTADDSYTFNYWMNSSTTYGSNTRYVFDTDQRDDGGTHIHAHSNNKTGGSNQFSYYDGSWNQIASKPDDGAWHMITWVVNSGDITVYQDTNQIGSTSCTTDNIEGRIGIGAAESGGASLTTRLSDFALWDRVLDAAERKFLYNPPAGSGTFTTDYR